MTDFVERMRQICAALPEVTERPSHGAPTWFVRDKKSFAMLWAEGHHDNGFPHLWLAAPTGEQEALVARPPHERPQVRTWLVCGMKSLPHTTH